MIASILCGGEGTRLRPLTYAVPKPMLPLGSKPILEVTLSQMKEQGFKTFYLMVNYKAEMIRSYFGSGSSFGVEIEYIQEREKRGTAGPLSELKDKIDAPFVVMNADLLTALKFSDLMKFHSNESASLTVALKRFDRKITYGVVELDSEHNITEISEKPTFSFLINSGIYVISPEILTLIPDEGIFHMTDLIPKSIEEGKKVVGYQFTEAWRDIGRMDDYMKTINDFENGQVPDSEGVFL